MATNTAFVPDAGQQAGTAVNGGGLVPAGAAQATALGGARGPAAWNDDWAKKFKDAGAPPEIIQQLAITGAMGADVAQLQQMLDQIKGEIDTQLAKFAHDHPEAFKKLRGNPQVDRAMIAQFAAGVNSGQVTAEQLEQEVDNFGKSQGKQNFDMYLKPMIVWSLIPGWGAIRLGIAPFTGGKDPLTGEKMFGDGMSTAFTVMAAIGGGMTIYNNVRGAMHVAAGHAAIRAGGDAATMAAHGGIDNLSLGRKLWSYVPGTQLNKQVGILGGLDDIKAGIDKMEGVVKESAQNVYNKALAGDVPLWRDSASKWSAFGYQPNARGIILGNILGKKGGMSVQAEGARQVILVDSRTTGKAMAAHLAAWGAEFADDVTTNGIVQPNLRTRILQEFSKQAANPALLRERILGEAGKQLLKKEMITRPTGIQGLLGKIRPGGLQDVLWATDNLAANKLGTAHGWHGIPRPGRWGIGGSVAAAGVYFVGVKPQLDASKKAAEEAAKQQAGAGGMTAEDQALLQQFAALPKDQQTQIIQQQHAQIQQAVQTPNMTPEQQQQLAAAQAELQLLMQVANGQMPTADAAAAGVGAPAAAGGTPQFTAQGLGLAN